MLDIDHFKRFNDTYGHAVGDQVLVKVADCFRKSCRDSDFAARFGGEEFVLLLEEADSHNALKFAERLREAITELSLSGIEQTITASLGIACLRPETQSLDELIIRADRALYEAKHSGRNRCCVDSK
jgi:diguanylate cyclase (GGDEF)-like protein